MGDHFALEYADSAANGRQIGQDPGGSDDRRGKPHRDEVERAKLPEGDLLLDDKGGALCEKARILITLVSIPVVWEMISIPVAICHLVRSRALNLNKSITCGTPDFSCPGSDVFFRLQPVCPRFAANLRNTRAGGDLSFAVGVCC